MGQYYRPVVGNSRGEIQAVYNLSIRGFEKNYSVGAKLMEHAWTDNPFMICFCANLYKKGAKRIAWVGDYVTPLDFMYSECDEARILLFSDIWHRDSSGLKSVKDFGHFAYDRGFDFEFLINHDTYQYIDMDEYCLKSATKDGIIHPLPLLTAIGNGRGGGDYSDDNRDYDNVGIWAYHLLSLDNFIPIGFKKFEVSFVEDGGNNNEYR